MTPFTLTPAEPNEPLPEGIRLNYEYELVGHKIIAVIDEGLSRLANGNEIVLITETRCFMVIGADRDGDHVWPQTLTDYGNHETLHDWVSSSSLLAAGVISAGEAELLRKAEEEREQQERQQEAERLRARLAVLLGQEAQ